MVEELLQFFIGVVDAELLKGIHLKQIIEKTPLTYCHTIIQKFYYSKVGGLSEQHPPFVLSPVCLTIHRYCKENFDNGFCTSSISPYHKQHFMSKIVQCGKELSIQLWTGLKGLSQEVFFGQNCSEPCKPQE